MSLSNATGPPRTELNSSGLNSPPGPRRRPLILHPVLQIRHARGACAGEPALRRREHGRPRADTHGRQISGAGPHNAGRPLSFCRMLMKTGCFPDNLPVEPGVFAGDFGQRDHFFNREEEAGDAARGLLPARRRLPYSSERSPSRVRYF